MLGINPILAMIGMAGAPQGSVPLKPISGAVDIASKWGVVTSVRRSPERNRAVGGVPNSFHLSGRAIDIARRPGVRHADIVAAYRKAGYSLLESLDEGDHSHFAFGTVGASITPTHRLQQFASAEPAEACATLKVATAMNRRRPDRASPCEAPEPAPKLRPIDPAD